MAPPGVLDSSTGCGGELLDVAAGRNSAEAKARLAERGTPWRDHIRFTMLDLSTAHGPVFTLMTSDAVQVTDTSHQMKLANKKRDECRGWMQIDTLGHRGHKANPLDHCQRLVTKSGALLDERWRKKFMGFLRAGVTNQEVWTAECDAKEAVTEFYAYSEPNVSLEWVTQLGGDLKDENYPIQTRNMGGYSLASVTRSRPGARRTSHPDQLRRSTTW